MRYNKIIRALVFKSISRSMLLFIMYFHFFDVSAAYRYTINGVNYERISDNELAVIRFTDNYEKYVGDIIIPSSVTLFDGSVCSVVAIADGAFAGASQMTSITLPNTIKSIGINAFGECKNLTSVVIPNSVTLINNNAFQYCKNLQAVDIQCFSVSFGEEVFGNCNSLANVTISSSIESLGKLMFMNCYNLTSIILPNSLKTINYGAFYNTGLKSITIPNSVTSIENRAFYNCSFLSIVDSKIENPYDIDASVFEYSYWPRTLQVPKGTKSKYLQLSGWTNSFKTIEEIGSDNYYNLSITSIGEGYAKYNEVFIRNEIKTLSFSERETITIAFIPDDGYRIKNLKVNGSSITANASYTATIDTDTTIEVEFEAIPPTTYSLSVIAKGNGSASYGGETIRGTTKTYTVNEGTSATISFTPDNGYRIKSLKVNGSLVTASASYNAMINANTTIEVEFEAIPDTQKTYTLSITSIGNGSASYSGETIRGTAKSYSVNEGTSVTINFSPDSGYRIKSLKVNGSSVSTTTSYTFTINSNTTIEVEFEPIPDTPSITTYTLSITASGNGLANYGGEAIRESSRNYSINEGSSVSISFTPDEGYQIESVKVNGSNIGDGNSYSTTVNANTTVEVVFEAIPVTTYTLTVAASGNGIATFNGTEVRNGSYTFTVNEGSDAIISFTPDKGYKVDAVKADGNEVEVSESYTISNITSDKTLEVAFAEMDRNFSIDGVGYQIESFEDNSVTLTGVQNSITLEVSDKVNYQALDWNIIGISENALENSEDLAAIIWNPEIPFTAKVANPNLLLYVKDEAYAPAGIRNVVVNGFAKAITLTDAQSGNNFYCPSAFITQSIIYTHNYSMKTGINESKGWETIALPFDVQQISHSGKGEIIPFAKWNADNDTKPFWLYELKGTGFVEAEELKANTPYIISMPNNDLYLNEYQLSGRVTFSALNAEVKKSDDIQTATFGNNTFVPAFTSHNAESGYYALNVNNDFETYQGSANVGSKFILNLRRIHPFEAYMTSTSGTRSIDIFDSMTTGIRDVLDITDSQKTQKVYDLSGRLIMTGTSLESIRQELPAGVYIINNKKMIIK